MKDNKRNARLGIVFRLIGMSVLPVVILGIILTVYGQFTLRKNMKDEIYEGLKSAAVAMQGAYDAAGQGDFVMLESGNVIKGTFVVNGNYSLVDKMREDSNIDASFFFGEKQMVTSIKNSSEERLLEVTPEEEVRKQVLQKGKEYFSEQVKVGSDTYYGYYMPVKNEDGSVVGMIFTGKKAASVENVLNEERKRMVSISVIVIAAAILGTILMSSTIVRALKHALQLFGKVAEGDLTEQKAGKQRYENRKDEIGDMLGGIGRLRVSLQEIIGNIHSSSDILMKSAEELESTAVLTSQNSGEVGKAIEEIAKGASSQAEETSSAMEHVERMGVMIEKIVEDVHLLTERATDMGRTGTEVNHIVLELSEYTNKTSEVVDVIAKQTQTTNLSAQEIQKAVGMISAIAEETNLLSLNASIEAARAGEQGRGFAIVATQIQKLAEQSNASAKQIEEVIAVLLEDAQTTVHTMDEVVQIVTEQKEKLNETGERFEAVNIGIQESLEGIRGIQEKSKILDESRNEILNVVSSLSAISEENAAAAEETTASTEELNERIGKMAEEAMTLKKLAENLEGQIQVFQV